jgi:hypothetical protein
VGDETRRLFGTNLLGECDGNKLRTFASLVGSVKLQNIVVLGSNKEEAVCRIAH